MVKIGNTKDGFIVLVNNNQIILFDENGIVLQRKNVNFESKEVTTINGYENEITCGFTDGSILIMDDKTLIEKELLICHEGAIKTITSNKEYTFAITSNNNIILIDNEYHQIISLFTPLSISSSLVMIDNKHLLVGTTNSLLTYTLNTFTNCCSIDLKLFYHTIPQCMTTLNHSFIKNIHQLQTKCSICKKKLSHDDLCCRHCHLPIHCHCLNQLVTDCPIRSFQHSFSLYIK